MATLHVSDQNVIPPYNYSIPILPLFVDIATRPNNDTIKLAVNSSAGVSHPLRSKLILAIAVKLQF